MRNIFIFLLLIALGGCSLSPIHVAPESSYTITKWPQENTDLAQKKSISNKTILVTTPVASPGYETASMIYVTVPYELRSFTNHRWVASPAQLLLPLLADRIRARGFFKGVMTSPFSGGATYQLNTQLLSLQQEFLQPQSQIRLRMQATLLNVSTGEMIASGIFQSVVSAQRNDPYAGVLATNEAANQVLGKIARWVVANSSFKRH